MFHFFGLQCEAESVARYVLTMELFVAKGITAKDSFLSVNSGPDSLIVANTVFRKVSERKKNDQNKFQLKSVCCLMLAMKMSC